MLRELGPGSAYRKVVVIDAVRPFQFGPNLVDTKEGNAHEEHDEWQKPAHFFGEYKREGEDPAEHDDLEELM